MSYPDANTPEPLTEIYEKLMNGLKTCRPLQNLVRPGNFVDVAQPAAQEKVNQASTSVRFPQMLLTMAGFKPNIWAANSMAVGFSQKYALRTIVEMITIDQINQVKWYTAAAQVALGPKLGLPYVERWDIESGSEGFARVAANEINTTGGRSADQPRWFNVLIINVQGKVSKASLKSLVA